MNTYEDLYNYAAKNGKRAAMSLLRQYILDDQPDEFMPGFTTRAMCRAAGAGLDGTPIDEIPACYLDTIHGPALYAYMWSGDEYLLDD